MHTFFEMEKKVSGGPSLEVHHVLVVPEKLENEICGIKDKFLEQNYTNALCVHSSIVKKSVCVCMYMHT